VLALGVAEEAAWFGVPEVNAEEVGAWIDSEGGLDPGVVAVDPAGAVGGFASPGRHQAVLLADPSRAAELIDELLPWLRAHGDAVELMTFAADAERVAAFERHGLRHRRSSFSLARPDDAGPVPAAVFPDGVDVAPYAPGEDDQAVHRLLYVDAAWASVPGHAARDLDDWREKDLRCPSLFVARRAGRPVGWVAGRLLHGGRGYVNTLAVAADERGRGLGRALLLRSFADLERLGARGLALGVEAANDAALGLYRSVGLEVEREWRTYGAP
jgi:GNAT superfamily N-acetyltransferase